MANINARKNKDGKIISYRIRVFNGKDENGKLRNFKIKTWKVPEGWSEAKIQKELIKIATKFEDECKNGLIATTKNPIFRTYARYVIDLKERNGLKHQTINLYNSLLERINLAIGHIKLTDLRPHHLNLLYEQLASYGMNLTTGKELSAKTIREHHSLIRTILAQAEKEMIVPYNVALKASPPRSKRKQAKYLEIDEIKRILKLLETEPLKWQLVIHLLVTTGCRRGEILGLKWENINFKEKEIFINNNLLYSVKKGIYEETPKTESSIRYIKLPEQTINLLKIYKKHYMEQKLTMGSKWIDNRNFVFTQENGMPMHPDSPTDYCKKLEKKYNKIVAEENKTLPIDEQIKKITISPHVFRHSQASILIFMKVDPVTVSKRLGHAQVSTTSDIYSHIMKKADEESANTISKILG